MITSLSIGNRQLDLSTPHVMGILNVTPDSFSDGGLFTSVESAVQHALQMQNDGAVIIDIGGESTRPGAEAVSVDEELERVIPVIEGIRQYSDVLLSIDTSKAGVMRQAVNAGADMVNDVNALREDKALDVCAELQQPVCLMHMLGEPRTMQNEPRYENVVEDIKRFLQDRINACLKAGIKRERLIVDPGFGFGKTLAHNISLLEHLDALLELDLPILVGISRKSMIGSILDEPVGGRLYGSIAAAVMAFERGARLFRVHDVKASVDALKICHTVKICRSGILAANEQM